MATTPTQAAPHAWGAGQRLGGVRSGDSARFVRHLNRAEHVRAAALKAAQEQRRGDLMAKLAAAKAKADAFKRLAQQLESQAHKEDSIGRRKALLRQAEHAGIEALYHIRVVRELCEDLVASPVKGSAEYVAALTARFGRFAQHRANGTLAVAPTGPAGIWSQTQSTAAISLQELEAPSVAMVSGARLPCVDCVTVRRDADSSTAPVYRIYTRHGELLVRLVDTLAFLGVTEAELQSLIQAWHQIHSEQPRAAPPAVFDDNVLSDALQVEPTARYLDVRWLRRLLELRYGRGHGADAVLSRRASTTPPPWEPLVDLPPFVLPVRTPTPPSEADPIEEAEPATDAAPAAAMAAEEVAECPIEEVEPATDAAPVAVPAAEEEVEHLVEEAEPATDSAPTAAMAAEEVAEDPIEEVEPATDSAPAAVPTAEPATVPAPTAVPTAESATVPAPAAVATAKNEIDPALCDRKQRRSPTPDAHEAVIEVDPEPPAKRPRGRPKGIKVKEASAAPTTAPDASSGRPRRSSRALAPNYV